MIDVLILLQMPEKIQSLRKALMDYLIDMSAQDPVILVRIMCQLLLESPVFRWIVTTTTTTTTTLILMASFPDNLGSQYHNVRLFWLLQQQEMTVFVVMTTGTLKTCKFQSDHHYPHANTHLFTSWITLLVAQLTVSEHLKAHTPWVKNTGHCSCP